MSSLWQCFVIKMTIFQRVSYGCAEYCNMKKSSGNTATRWHHGLSTMVVWRADPSENCHLIVLKLQKNLTFFFNGQWQFCWKKDNFGLFFLISSFWQFLDSQMAIFQRVRWRWSLTAGVWCTEKWTTILLYNKSSYYTKCEYMFLQ